MTPEEWLAKALWRDQWDYDGGRLEAAPSGFIVCDECEGKGGAGVVTCPSCRGSGLVPTDELREKATDTLLHVLYLGADRSQLGSMQVRMHERAADAVLRLVAEHLGERE